MARIKSGFEDINLAADRDNLIYRIWPTYVLSDSIKVEATRTIIGIVRQGKIDMDPWNIRN
jgi:hypothetical protein